MIPDKTSDRIIESLNHAIKMINENEKENLKDGKA
jgi:hypothetical protein